MDNNIKDCVANVPKTGVAKVIAEQDISIRTLADFVSKLGNKLQPIMNPMPRTQAEVPTIPVPQVCPVSENIRDNTREIDIIAASIMRMFDEIEL